jgi:hypothetical protein
MSLIARAPTGSNASGTDNSTPLTAQNPRAEIDDSAVVVYTGTSRPADTGEHRSRRTKKRSRRKAKRHRRESSSGSSSDSSDTDSSRHGRGEPRKKKKKAKNSRRRRRGRGGDSRSGSDSQTGRSGNGSDGEDSDDDISHLTAEQIRAGKLTWNLLEKAWPFDQRPSDLQKRKNVYLYRLDELLKLKTEIYAVEDKKNLGEEVFSRDGKPEKIRYKSQTDDGVKKLHPARTNRQPLSHPKSWYNIVPKKRETVIRNFPMDHLGLTGHITEVTIGKMHNRSVRLTLDMFCKATHHEANGPHKAGKYSEGHQLRDGIGKYVLALHSLWPSDYTGVVLVNVLNEVHWAENASPDNKKRCELITEFFNSVMNDNCGKTVHGMYPLVYEQVRAILHWLMTKNMYLGTYSCLYYVILPETS